MARFYVGQRVRILWSFNWPEPAGASGVILAEGAGDGHWMVAPDAWGTDCAPRVGDRMAHFFYPYTDQLAPATPPHIACGQSLAELMDGLRSGAPVELPA